VGSHHYRRSGDSRNFSNQAPVFNFSRGATMTEDMQPVKRERGTGSIFHNGSAVWWIKFYARGIPQRESSHSTDLAVAKKLLRRRLAEVETKTYVMRTNVKIEELIADLLAEYRRERRKSLAYVEMRWRKHLQPAFDRLRADDLTTDMVQRYSTKREEEGASGPTVNRELAILKRAYYLALRSSPPKVRTVPAMPMYKESDPRTGFLEDAATCAWQGNAVRKACGFAHY
jgi:hypothetical protein